MVTQRALRGPQVIRDQNRGHISVVATLKCTYILIKGIMFGFGPGSSVGTETYYGLDGPGIESRWGEVFGQSIPALGPTQLPVQWVPGLSRG